MEKVKSVAINNANVESANKSIKICSAIMEKIFGRNWLLGTEHGDRTHSAHTIEWGVSLTINPGCFSYCSSS